MSTVLAGSNGLRKSSKDKVSFEERWTMAAKAGYALAFEELVIRNQSRIYRLALNITQNQQDAEALLQDTFIEAQEHLQEFRGGSRFSSWLVRICIRKALLKFQEREPNWTGLDEFEESNDDLVPNELGDWGDCPEKRYAKTKLNRILSEATCVTQESLNAGHNSSTRIARPVTVTRALGTARQESSSRRSPRTSLTASL